MEYVCSGCGKVFEGPLSHSSHFDNFMPDNDTEPGDVFCSYECSVAEKPTDDGDTIKTE